jgi:hypothetical protein
MKIENKFTPRNFDEFKSWILSEIGDITIAELMEFYKKITEEKKSSKKEKQ